jgi:hypothetical protein
VYKRFLPGQVRARYVALLKGIMENSGTICLTALIGGLSK